jgi:hypothetical protein
VDTVAAVSLEAPWPPDGRHATDVADAQAAVKQLLNPNTLLGVASRKPKFSPDTVTVHETVVAAFALSRKLTTGAGGKHGGMPFATLGLGGVMASVGAGARC